MKIDRQITNLGPALPCRILRCIRNIIGIAVLTAAVILLAAAIFLCYEYGPDVKQYYEEAKRTVEESTLDTFRLNETSYVYADDGTMIAKLKKDTDCEYVHYEGMPHEVIDAFVAIEDKRFYEHDGVDWLSTCKAAYLLLKDREISRGGSTITQQLARNVFLSFEQTYERKIKEIFLAIELNRKYSRKQILEFYVNNINFGNGYFGISSAAKGYFGKKVSRLSYEQIALLCAVPNNPTYYNPRKHLDHAIQRRNLILREMYEQGYLAEKEYLKAVNKPVRLADSTSAFYNYEGSYAIKCAVEYLMGLSGFVFQYSWDNMTAFLQYRDDYEEQFSVCRTKLYSGGYTVRTSLDLETQKKLQRSLDKGLAVFTEKDEEGVYRMQGAAVVVSGKSGKVIAAVGGRTQEELGLMYSLNRAYQSYRQPGSVIKPLIVYTPALEKGYGPDSIVDDFYSEDGPRNSDDRYDGEITLRTAVEQSKNVTAWNIFKELTPQRGIVYVQQMRFSRVTPNDYYLPSSLGGWYYGVTAEEMASGYAALVNDGIYRQPSCLVSFKDSGGTELFREQSGIRVYEKNAARMMVSMLQGVASNGTAKGLALAGSPEMPIACKTGTTSNQECGWFCGSTPYYSCAVYVAADEASSTDGLQGSTYPMTIWKDIQSFLNKDKKIKNFKQPKGLVKKKEKTESTVPKAGILSEEPVEEPAEQPALPPVEEPEPAAVEEIPAAVEEVPEEPEVPDTIIIVPDAVDGLEDETAAEDGGGDA